MTLHSKILFSSTRPAENPSTGFLQRSTRKPQNSINKNKRFSNKSQPNQNIICLSHELYRELQIPLSCFCRRRLAWEAIEGRKIDTVLTPYLSMIRLPRKRENCKADTWILFYDKSWRFWTWTPNAASTSNARVRLTRVFCGPIIINVWMYSLLIKSISPTQFLFFQLKIY